MNSGQPARQPAWLAKVLRVVLVFILTNMIIARGPQYIYQPPPTQNSYTITERVSATRANTQIYA